MYITLQKIEITINICTNLNNQIAGGNEVSGQNKS